MAIRVAIVGLGGRGQDWIREVRTSPTFELAGCVETDQAVLQSATAKLQIPDQQCFSNLEQALDQAPCQAVIVATPADCHVAASEAALSRKLAVLVEKPFTLHLNEAVKLVSLAEATNTPLLVAQNFRYMRSFRTARRLVQEGLLGNVGMVVMHYYRIPHEMAASLARLPHNVLWGMGVHHLDVIRFILAKEVTSVVADSFTAPWGRLPQGTSLHAMLSMADEARVLYTATYESSGHEYFERGQEFYARFVGERATLHVFQRWLILCERGKLPRPIRRGPRKTTEEQAILGQFERAILHGEVSEVSGRDNLQTVALLEACVRSATEKRFINPRELLDESE
jgi:predicted dehydrogenase